MKYLSPFFLISCISLATNVFAQTKIKDNTVTGTSSLPNSAAILELESNNKGLLLPRINLVTTSSWSPLLGSPVIGMTVYNTSAAITSSDASYPVKPGGTGSYYWDGTGWVAMAYPSAANIPTIYTADGTLTGDRTVTLGTHTLNFYNSDATVGGSYEFASAGSGPGIQLTPNSSTGLSSMRLNSGDGQQFTLQMFSGNVAQINTTSASGLNIVSNNASSLMRFLIGTNDKLDMNNTGVGVGGATSPNSTLQVQGSVSTSIIVVTASYTALATDYTIVFNTTTAGTTLTLPNANTCQGRIYVLVNFADAVNIGINPSAPIYSFSGGAITNLPTDNGSNGSNLVTGNRITIQSTGTMWVVISAG